jgi:hypothetical protein
MPMSSLQNRQQTSSLKTLFSSLFPLGQLEMASIDDEFGVVLGQVKAEVDITNTKVSASHDPPANE